MKVIRVSEAHPYFSIETVNKGLAFLAVNEPHEYPFSFSIINHDEAVVHVFDEQFLPEVIEEFLYYSTHISKIKDQYGSIHFIREKVPIYKVPIVDLKVSQFYLSLEKYNQALSWISKNEDIIVPVMKSKEGLIVADGHTRLKVAMDKGYNEAYIYYQAQDDLLQAFYKEAQLRNINHIKDMVILSKEEYHEKWHMFCDKFIKAYEEHIKDELL
ncbi:hypothetical protein [Liberiplasma polymorphum]|uniref:hypothetical protein n=1 Tax=Liberiplasma polymorphum TaxID=3374570 RepID=UPI0037749748